MDIDSAVYQPAYTCRGNFDYSMRKVLILISLLLLLAIPVSAVDFTAPAVPEGAEKYMPENTASFGDDLWYIVKSAVSQLQPGIAEAAQICFSLLAVTLLTSILKGFSGISADVTELVGTLSIGLLLLQPSRSLIQLGIDTITELSEYGKLLLPVMTAATAAQGGTVTSATIYTGTVFFNALLTTGISKLIIPMVYVFMALSVAFGALGDDVLKSLRDLVKWLITWSLKIILYVFTGYLGITGVVSGTTDAAAVKAAKLTISGFVPVVGNIVSDASEAILVSADVMKNAAGIYGLLAVIAICIGPFLKIAVQYILLKLTASVCAAFGTKKSSDLIKDFSGVMGLLLAMTGTVCLLLLISTVCLMKGVT